jgi:hypothetical protein
MRRTEPPPIATWVLEHCAVGDRNDALAGDLREGYSSGLPVGWYWRQVFAACAVSWTECLRLRTPWLIFALLWSVLAPAWKVFIDGIESAQVFDRLLQPFDGLWILPAFAGWVILNSTFLWVGILVYILTLSVFGKTFHAKMIRRAFLLTPLIFVPVFGAWFALCMLDWTFPFANEKLATTPWGQIADLRMLADVLRFPYFITLVCVLWNVIPKSKHTHQLLPVDSLPIESSTQSDLSSLDSQTVKRFFAFMVGAGLINALLAGILLCRLPELRSPTFSTLLARSILHIVIGVIAGVGGSWLYWKNPSSPFRKRSPIPFPLFALVCASGWIWVSPMAIYSEQLSPATAIVAAIGAAFLAIGLRHATFSVFAPTIPDAADYGPEDAEMFSRSLYRAPLEAEGYVITFLLYAAGCALAMRLNLTAAATFALCAFLFIWKQTLVKRHDFDSKHEYRRATLRLACVALPAVLITVWALLDGATHRARLAEMNAAASAVSGVSTSDGANQKANSESPGLGGYESLILWPVPEKKQIVPPLSEISFLAPGTTQPLVIPFNGQYWYMQPPNKTPGPTAHRAHGTPLGEEIASLNSKPLIMDAHQPLGSAIPVARCREIQVEIENRDNRIGVVGLGVLLTDGASSKSQTLYLGQQSIVSTEPEHFSYKSEPVFETLRFSVPTNAKIRRFDEITVMMLPDVEHALVGPKIAIKQFQLLPR